MIFKPVTNSVNAIVSVVAHENSQTVGYYRSFKNKRCGNTIKQYFAESSG